MKTTMFLAATALAVACGTSARAADQPSALGFWVTQDHEAVAEISQCDSGLCGRLVGLRHDHPPGEIPKDVHNSDAAKRDVPLCGLLMLGSFKPAKGDPTKWEDGWAYDPDAGKTYSGQMTLTDANTLKLRGYIGIPLLGRTEIWTREPTTGTPNRCSLPAAG